MQSKVMTVFIRATVGAARAVGTLRRSLTQTGRRAEETVQEGFLEEVTSS